MIEYEKVNLEKSPEVTRITPELEERLRNLYEKYRPKTESSLYLGCYDMSVVISGEFGFKIVEGYFLRNDASGTSE